jgi:hypothetical protein
MTKLSMPTVALVAAWFSAGCAGTQDPGPVPKPNAEMNTPAYQTGFATVLQEVPVGLSEYGINWVRTIYDLAFRTGSAERKQRDHADEALFISNGCFAASQGIPSTGAEEAQRATQKCLDLVKDALAKDGGGPKGPMYAKVRLIVASKGVEAQDRVVADLMNFAFVVGYHEGFFAAPPVQVYKAVKVGCMFVAAYRLSQQDAEVRCTEIGADEQRKYLSTLEALRQQMNP